MKIELDQNDTETLQRLKDKALMLKIICLDEAGKPPLTDVSRMTKRDKVKLKVEIEKKWDSMPDAEILKTFNEICTETIFDENGVDYERMPVFQSSRPELPEKEVERIKSLPPSEQVKVCGRVLSEQPKNEITVL